jgi:hypothetical protein
MFRFLRALRQAKVDTYLDQVYDGRTPSQMKKSLYDKIQDWEDSHPKVVWFVAGVGVIFILVAICAAGYENGWYHIGQSLKETFWPWS